MADNVDLAQEVTDLIQTTALEKARSNIPLFTGQCANCGDEITKGRFCGRECRDDAELWAKGFTG